MPRIPGEDLLPGENQPVAGQVQTFRPGYTNPYGPTVNMSPQQSAARANKAGQGKQSVERELDTQQAALQKALADAEEARRKALFGDSPAGFIGPTRAGTGAVKYDYAMNLYKDPNTGLWKAEPGTHDHDQYILNLPYDPNDAEYNKILYKSKQEAMARERRRGLVVDPSQANAPGYVLAQIGPAMGRQSAERKEGHDQAARDKALFNQEGADYEAGNQPWHAGGEDSAAHRNRVLDYNQQWYETNPMFVDAYGNPINNPASQGIPVGAQSANGLPKNNASGLTLADASDQYGDDTQVDDIVGNADGDDLVGAGEVNARQYVNSVGAVYMGTQAVQGKYGVTYRPVYRTQTDVEADIYRWTPAEVAAYQRAMGLKQTGVVDTQYTLKLWKVQVQSAANYASQGQNVGMDFVVAGYAKAARGGGYGGGGGGYGGGGGGGGAGKAKLSRDQAKALLNPVMREYAGREATDSEVSAFLPAAQSAFDANPEGWAGDQFTIDWVKGRLPQEVGSLQAATNYYDVVRSVLGGGGVG